MNLKPLTINGIQEYIKAKEISFRYKQWYFLNKEHPNYSNYKIRSKNNIEISINNTIKIQMDLITKRLAGVMKFIGKKQITEKLLLKLIDSIPIALKAIRRKERSKYFDGLGIHDLYWIDFHFKKYCWPNNQHPEYLFKQRFKVGSIKLNISDAAHSGAVFDSSIPNGCTNEGLVSAAEYADSSPSSLGVE
jgi:hypothetical protein